MRISDWISDVCSSDLSRICLGTMAYAAGAGGAHPWALSEEASQPFYKRAIEAGINFFDTANVYSSGTSEEFLGRAVKKYAKRDEKIGRGSVRERVGHT